MTSKLPTKCLCSILLFISCVSQAERLVAMLVFKQLQDHSQHAHLLSYHVPLPDLIEHVYTHKLPQRVADDEPATTQVFPLTEPIHGLFVVDVNEDHHEHDLHIDHDPQPTINHEPAPPSLLAAAKDKLVALGYDVLSHHHWSIDDDGTPSTMFWYDDPQSSQLTAYDDQLNTLPTSDHDEVVCGTVTIKTKHRPHRLVLSLDLAHQVPSHQLPAWLATTAGSTKRSQPFVSRDTYHRKIKSAVVYYFDTALLGVLIKSIEVDRNQAGRV